MAEEGLRTPLLQGSTDSVIDIPHPLSPPSSIPPPQRNPPAPSVPVPAPAPQANPQIGNEPLETNTDADAPLETNTDAPLETNTDADAPLETNTDADAPLETNTDAGDTYIDPAAAREVDVRATAGGEGAAQPTEDVANERKPLYAQEIVPPKQGFIIKINGCVDLDPLRDLAKEKEELNNYVRGIFKAGRELKYEIVVILAGTLTLGLISALTTTLLAEEVSFGVKWTVLVVFGVVFSVFICAAIYELCHIYDPALADSYATHASLIRRMNLARDKLIVLQSEPIVNSTVEQEQLDILLTQYCDKIIGPLPIACRRSSCFFQVGSLILIIVVASIFIASAPPPLKKHDHHIWAG